MKFKHLILGAASLTLVSTSYAFSGLGQVAGTTANNKPLTAKQEAFLNKMVQHKVAHDNALKGSAILEPKLGFGFDGRTGMANGSNCLANASDPNAIIKGRTTGNIDFKALSRFVWVTLKA